MTKTGLNDWTVVRNDDEGTVWELNGWRIHKIYRRSGREVFYWVESEERYYEREYRDFYTAVAFVERHWN